MPAHQIIQTLLDLRQEDLLPSEDTSSHWQRYGQATEASIVEDSLLLRGVGFGDFEAGRLEWLHSSVGRWFFHDVTSRIRAYSKVQSAARQLASDLGIGFTYEAWRQAVSVAVLLDLWETRSLDPRTFAMIGDGYGYCGALIRRLVPGASLLQVDLPKILVFQVSAFLRADPSASLGLLTETENADVIFAQPAEIESYRSNIDCAVNMASMGEMTFTSIERYFYFLRKRSGQDSHFYCVNRESKTHPDGTEIRFKDYPWDDTDEIFLDGRCPYYTHYWARRGDDSAPRIAGLRVPFLRGFDGPLMHRLARLTPMDVETAT